VTPFEFVENLVAESFGDLTLTVKVSWL